MYSVCQHNSGIQKLLYTLHCHLPKLSKLAKCRLDQMSLGPKVSTSKCLLVYLAEAFLRFKLLRRGCEIPNQKFRKFRPTTLQ